MSFEDFDKIKGLILLLNKIRFENYIKYLVKGCFEILESFGGESEDKIKYK